LQAYASLPATLAAVPGPGSWAVTDVGGNLSVADGTLAFADGTGSYGDTEILGSSLDWVAGLAMFVLGVTSDSAFGYGLTAPLFATTVHGNTGFFVRDGSDGVQVRSHVAGTIYDIAIVLHETGTFYLARNDDGLAAWTLLWVSANASATVAPWVASDLATASVDAVRVAQLPSPWDVDSALVADRQNGTFDQNDTLVHPTAYVLTGTITTVASSIYRLALRYINDDEKWELWFNGSGPTRLVLYEFDSEGFTQRASSSTGVYAANDRFVVIVDGPSIQVYVDGDDVLSYNSAAAYAASSTIRCVNDNDEDISNLTVYDRHPAGPAKAVLDVRSEKSG